MVSLTNAYSSIRSTFTITNTTAPSSSLISNYDSSTAKEATTTTTTAPLTRTSSLPRTLLMKRKATIINSNKKKKNDINKKITEAQQKAQNQIKKSPTSPKGYLTSGHYYKQHDNLDAALDSYTQGLKMVSTYHPLYKLLQYEKDRVISFITLSHKQQRLSTTDQAYNDSNEVYLKLQRFPSEILPIIFQDLTVIELLNCMNVSQTWHHFILNWPVFWEKITISSGFSQQTMSTVKLLLLGQIQEWCLEGSVGTELNKSLVQFLIHSCANQLLESLSLKDLRLNDTDGDLIAKLIESVPTLKRLEFINCYFQVISAKNPITSIQPILQVCSKKVTHLSFYQTCQTRPQLTSNPNYCDEFVTFPTNHDVSALSFPSVTYLKLFGQTLYTSHNQYSLKLSSQRGSRYPNLVYLYLDASVLTYECCSIIQDVVKYCPHILDIIVSDDAKMPQTCISNSTATVDTMKTNENNDNQLLSSRSSVANENKYNNNMMTSNNKNVILSSSSSSFSSSSLSSSDSFTHSTSSNNNKNTTSDQYQQSLKKGQRHRTIVLDSFLYVKLSQLDASTGILEKTHGTIELLYLRCQLQGNACYKTFNDLVSSYNYPQLRELVLSLKSVNPSPGASGINISAFQRNNNNKKSLDQLFVQCPNLEAITINTFNVINDPSIQVNDKVLESIAHNCPRLRHLHVLGRRQHTSEGMKQFSIIHNMYLTDLEMDIDRDALLTTIIRLKSLQRLELRNDTWSPKSRYTVPFFSDMVTVRRILYGRGGVFIEHLKGNSNDKK